MGEARPDGLALKICCMIGTGGRFTDKTNVMHTSSEHLEDILRIAEDIFCQ